MMIQRMTPTAAAAAIGSRPTPMEEMDDESLLAAIQDEADAEAYRVLVERHVDRAYAVALRMLGNVADAEDVAQDCLVKVWTHRDTWQPGRAKFSTWLYRVVINRCIDLRRRPMNEWIEDVPEPLADEPDSVTLLHRAQIYGRLEKEIRALPQQQRIALTLSYFDDLDNAGVAEVMGTTVSAVESLLKRARQTLRERLRRAERDCRAALSDD